MKSNRRGFIKLTGMTGIGLAGVGMLPGFSKEPVIKPELAVQDKPALTFVPLNRYH